MHWRIVFSRVIMAATAQVATHARQPNADGSLTIYLQNDQLSAGNPRTLPLVDAPLYSPQKTAQAGTRTPPGVSQ